MQLRSLYYNKENVNGMKRTNLQEFDLFLGLDMRH
jgi:hypothetical protein